MNEGKNTSHTSTEPQNPCEMKINIIINCRLGFGNTQTIRSRMTKWQIVTKMEPTILDMNRILETCVCISVCVCNPQWFGRCI